MEESATAMKERLQAFLQAESGEQVVIGEMRPLPGGASRETWAIRSTIAGRERMLVLRLDMASTMNPEALDRGQEFHLMQAAYQSNILAPQPLWLCTDPTVLGAPFFLMQYVGGKSIGPRVVRRPELAGARRKLPEQMAEQLARIHALPASSDTLSFLPRPPDNLSPAQHTVSRLRRSLAALGSHSPGLSATLRWLERNEPAPGPLHVLHGDFRIGNLIVNEEGLAAVIDWEFAHLGDPLEDVAWPLVRDWRFGNDKLRLGGIAPAEPFLEAYEEITRRALNRESVSYWEIMGNVKWAVTCLVQAERHLSGEDPSIELASLGRRSAEMELEALNLIAAYG